MVAPSEPKKRDRTEYNRMFREKHRERLRAKQAAYMPEYYLKNKDKINAQNRENYQKKKAERKATQAKWDAANPEKVKAIRQGINKRFYEKNRERLRQRSKDFRARDPNKHRAKVKEWQSKNREKVQAIKTRRKFRKANQLHPEMNCAVETAMFLRAQQLTQETGILHHVDHIIPLEKGGWHHHLNLQILPGSVNTAKFSDPFWEMPGYKSWRDVPQYLWPEKLRGWYETLLMV